MLEIGDKAPAFGGLDQDGEKISLAGLRGQWVVVYFYPRDDTPGCTTEACEFTAGIRAFERLDALVIGISPDGAERHTKFAAKYRLKVRLLPDEDHETLAAYGAWGEKTLYGKKSVGVIRSTVIVDPQGKIAWRWARVKAAGHAEAVRAKLEELRAARAAKA